MIKNKLFYPPPEQIDSDTFEVSEFVFCNEYELDR